MFQRIKSYLSVSSALLLLVTAGCKKGTFDINTPNPNQPSSVSPQFQLSAALTASAYASFNASGYTEFANLYMGYWAFSGDYGGYGTTATYNLNNGSYTGNWDYVYNTILVNYQGIINSSRKDVKQANFFGVAEIMEAFHFQRLVDEYNNIPYTQALQGGIVNYPKYDDGKTVYAGILKQIDSGIAAIQGAPADAVSLPSKYDVMFGGDMDMWVKFANTVKLRIVMNLTQTDEATTKAELNGLGTGDFLGVGEDAAINPGYSNANAQQQNPFWGSVGFTPSNSQTGNHQFYRANAYAVNFYSNHNDPRLNAFYDTTSDGQVHGRVFGSQNGAEHNTVISAIGSGVLQSPSQNAYILPAFESLFLQAEAAQRGYISGTASALYKSAVEESFRILGIDDAKTAADTYMTQSDAVTNYSLAGDKITFLVTQEWAALNMFDPVTSWNNWKRLKVPATLPVSIYPGTTAPHIPIRLIYPQSEYTANTANANAQGTVDIINGKIFWMP
ncbi:MAG TPA: SusD/RagB family nutrient-binding outer membrane lipoprotein [Puia sp.]|uniref:SusD/RagB family nutrient-binding outer membrane lipoprotein n=1 Tax=Puia sp. TaxID=2045100 RepID=UPI002C7D0CDF|nr:SusD/RagB family nutrient-binding outer membrane lipoprotein [Puia sp.]HVU93815.1 SusD/RagB family nutrient-binding outer membrane lipoprotein [Puia sp.]